MVLNRFHQVTLHARDLDEAIAFYRDMLGGRFQGKFDPPGLAFFDYSGVRLLLEKTGPKATVYFRVDDIESAADDLQSRGVTFTQEPQLIHKDNAGVFSPPGEEEWMAFFTDLSGNVLALASRRP